MINRHVSTIPGYNSELPVPVLQMFKNYLVTLQRSQTILRSWCLTEILGALPNSCCLGHRRGGGGGDHSRGGVREDGFEVGEHDEGQKES